MTITVECPHCESQFQLNPDVAGKSMRCPSCREIFTAQAPTPVPPPVPSSTPARTPSMVSDFVPVIDLLANDRPYDRVERSDLGAPTLETSGPYTNRPDDIPLLMPVRDDAPPRARPKSATPVAKVSTGPKEVVWTEDNVAPPAPRATSNGASIPVLTPVNMPTPITRLADEDEEEELFIRTRRRSFGWQKLAFYGVVFGILATVLGSGIGLWRYYALTEQRLAEEAKTAYDDGNFLVSHKKYEELLTDYPNSSNTDQYKFFTSLSEVQNAVGSVTARENPFTGLKIFLQFVETYGKDPLALPETGFGADIVQVGKRLTDTIADHANDRLVAFRANRAKMDELEAFENAITEGQNLIPVVDKFRDKQTVSLDAQRTKYEELTKLLAGERHRLTVLAPFRNITSDPTAIRIEEFEKALQEHKLTTDAEALKMLSDAERRLRELFGYTGRRAVAGLPPNDLYPPVLFSASVNGATEPRINPEAPSDVVFAVARGVLYALDSQTGALLWGTRVAAPTLVVDVPVRVTIGDQDWVLVAGDIGGQPGLTARVARTGEPIWYQRLEAAPFGRPLVVGGRVYQALSDPFGTIAEFETASGLRIGDLAIRQPIGAGLAMMPTNKPGSNLLVVAGDTKRVFLFELGREDDDGKRIQPRCVRVLITDHPRDSLRGEPVLISPVDENGPRYVILTQTDGPTSMKLRAFALPKPEEIIAAGVSVATESSERAAEVPVPGWSWFPGVSDGERFVLATDAGAFLALGVNQIGNADQPLFTLPGPKPVTEQEGVARSQVVSAEEDAYWVILSGQLLRLRTAVDPANGLRIISQGAGRPIGEPIHRAQLRPNLNLGVVVVRSGGSSNGQAVGFDLQSGQIRWQRRLGVSPAGPAVAVGNNTAIVGDEDGGVYSVTLDPKRTVAPSIVAKVIAAPYAESFGKAMIAASADGKSVWSLTPELDKAGRRIRLRFVAEGMLKTDVVVPMPDQLAGMPIVVGSSVLIPLVNGYLYRFSSGDSQLSVGPLWRGDGAAGELFCLLTAINGDEFLATDGSRKFLRWKWPTEADAKPAKVAGPWELVNKIAMPAAVLGADGNLQFAIADVTGTIFLYNADRPADPVRRWRGSEKGPIPVGKPTNQLAVVTTEGQARIVYTVANLHMVALDPTQAEPAWVKADLANKDVGELTGWTVAGSQVVVTDPTGRVLVFDAASGKLLMNRVTPPGQSIAISPAISVNATEAITITADGTGAVIPLQAK